MASASDISACEPVVWERLLRSRAPCVRARLFEGGQVVPARPMLWPCPVDEVQAYHQGQSVVPHADVYVVQKALVGGHGTHALKDGAFVYAAPAYPGYVHEYFRQGLASHRWSFDPARLRRKRLRRAFGMLHFNLMWGHWITEVFPKLFAIAALRERGIKAPVILPSDAPNFVRPMLEDVLPGQEVVVFDPAREYIQVDHLILPPMLQEAYVFHPYLNDVLDAYAGVRPGADGRLFVSRAGMHTEYSYRELENEAEVEALAAELGFDVVRPEMFPWREQLRLFAGARVIAGEYGSGLHNTLFSPRGAQVVSLNWITDVQSRVANFREQDVGYVLPDDGEPRRFSLEHSLQRFRIDPADLREKLSRVIDRA